MYTKSITRNNRALFVIAIDQSGSMAGEVKIGRRFITKSEMVAEVANDLIAELVERSRRNEGVRNYYDVAILGYSGEGVRSLLGDDRWLSITQLSQLEVEEREVEREYKLADGSTKIFSHRVRSWVGAQATGSTPMYEALLAVREIVGQWCVDPQNQDSFPPIIFNITDGESTDCDDSDLNQISESIKELATRDGDSLLFNVHIASSPSQSPLLFPSLGQLQRLGVTSRSALSLFHSASFLPPLFQQSFLDLTDTEQLLEAKAVSYNCSASELISILNIGSISVKRR